MYWLSWIGTLVFYYVVAHVIMVRLVEVTVTAEDYAIHAVVVFTFGSVFFFHYFPLRRVQRKPNDTIVRIKE